ncbi:MAG: flagellar assembly protein FliH [Spirochaetales bacterium]|nr:flagellar assembly protein FliH [Spirochaetales bacterium]
MAKNVFRSQEIKVDTSRVVLDSPFQEEAVEAVIQSPEEYTGPTADDLRREAEFFKAQWAQEKQVMVDEAKAEAERIIREAEEQAFQEVKEKNDQAQAVKQQAEKEAGKMISDAQGQAEELLRDAEAKADEVLENARKEGFAAGREEGFLEGKAEVERLIEQLHSILSKAIERRNQIIDESETQIVNLVLLISRKVIKVISENQKNVVINNVIQSLRKLKSRGDVIIRVNLEDVKLTSEHVKDFMRMVENVKSITVLEDSTVDKGGCIIETDFGQIDARISSQFTEIEEKILELLPIKIKGEK